MICTQPCSRSSRICRDKVQITEIDVLGYSLGGANAAIVKSIDATEGKLKIHRAVMINPPVSLFSSIGRLDKLFAINIGSGDDAIESLYRKLYAELANLYRASDQVQIDEDFMLGAAASVLKTDAEFSAAIALSFRIDLGRCVFRRRSVRGHGRRGRSTPSAEGRRFARGDAAHTARQAVLRSISRGLRALLFEAPAGVDRRIVDRGQSPRHHRRGSAQQPRLLRADATATT